MYELGEQFKVSYDLALTNPKSIILGSNYRISILTERLVRLEYNESGQFVDEPTELVWYRNFEVPKFEVKEDARTLEIKTSYFHLYYEKGKPFVGSKINPIANLKVQLVNSDRTWYYNHPEARNIGTPGFDLISQNGQQRFKRGLYSTEGFASIDDSNDNILLPNGAVKKKESQGIDIYLFVYQKDFEGCLSDYYKITGYPSLIPRYALGNWWSRNIDYNDVSLKNLIDEFNFSEIPLSVLLLDKDWHVRKYNGVNNVKSGFTFNKEYFEAPYEMISYLHSNGIRLGLNINPFNGIYPYEERYENVRQALNITEDIIIPFNVYDPHVLDTYLKELIHPLDDLGVDFFWIDFDDKKRLNDLWLLSHYQFYDMMRNSKRRPMVLTRNTSKAAHRYPILYSGKTIVGWDTLKSIPFHNVSATNMGVNFWAHDIGGYFKGIEDNNLYIRYVQLGVFSPILKFGAEKGKYYKREPWRWSFNTYEITKQYLQLRHRLIPYLYTEAYKYHKYGKPMVEPIYYKYPEMFDDVNIRNEYYFGSELFVCPIVNKKDYLMNRVIHRFYLPDGVWYDFVTGKKFPGNRNYISFFKDQDYPVFAKAGSIITFGENDNLNDTTPPKNMEIQIFPGKSNLYKLYEDDGVSDLYKKGYYLLTSIDYNYLPNNYTVIIRALEGKSGIVPDKRNYKIRFRNTKRANDVITYFNNDPIEANCYVDKTDFVVEVRDVPTIGQLTLNCKGNDIEIDAVRLINDDIESIISDLQIETEMKEKIDSILFSELPIKKKRIEIRKLGNRGLERKYVRLFLKLLEYIEQI